MFVSYKDTIFEPSSAIRHSAEFLNALNVQYEHQILPPILCLYTDGGPDHRCNYGSVQIALICLFLCGDFDLLVAVRTAPNHSWTNPAERIMSILNLGLQGRGLHLQPRTRKPGPANFILNRPGLGPGRQIFILNNPGRVRV